MRSPAYEEPRVFQTHAVRILASLSQARIHLVRSLRVAPSNQQAKMAKEG